MLVQPVTVPKEVLDYIPPEDERHLVDRIGDEFKFESLISRPSDQGTFVVAITDNHNNNEKAIYKASTNDDEHIVLENPAILNF